MPDNAELFWEASVERAPRLEGLQFAVLALGDTGYDDFCQAGKLIDTRLEQLGARRLIDRVDCDVDYEDPAAEWIAGGPGACSPTLDGAAATARRGRSLTEAPAKKKSQWTRKNPYRSRLAVNRLLSAPGQREGDPALRVRPRRQRHRPTRRATRWPSYR